MKDGRELQRRISEGNAMPFSWLQAQCYSSAPSIGASSSRFGKEPVSQDECDLSESDLSIVEFGSAT